MNKKIIINPCSNMSEIIDIAKNYISDSPKFRCQKNGAYHRIIITRNDNSDYVGSVEESKSSIIFKGKE